MSEDRSVSPPPQRTRRRNRIITSCLECRRRKLKCDRLHPCNHCIRGGRDCVFLAPARDPASKDKLTQFKQSMEALEKELEIGSDETLSSGWRLTMGSGGKPTPITTPAPLDSEVPDDERTLEPTPLALADITYADDGNDAFDDLGVQFGRMRITERIGGFVRPALADEFADIVRRRNQTIGGGTGASPPSSADSPASLPSQPQYSSHLEPSTSFISPGSTLLLSGSPSEDASLLDFLPSRELGDKLLEQYWKSVHPIIHIVHRPSHERAYRGFWQAVGSGYEPANSTQALIFASFFCAAISLPDGLSDFQVGFQKRDMVKTFQAGCEWALQRANFIRTSKVETIQALTMYLTPMCRMEISRSHCALISTAIRIAFMAGLHKDGTLYGLSAVDVHVRRLVWYHLMFLDARSYEAMGPPAQIRDGDFDTKLPMNTDDSSMEGFMLPGRDSDRWTDVTFTKIKFEVTEHRYELFTFAHLFQKKQMTVHAILRNIDEFRQRMEKKYLPMINVSVPIQALGLALIRLYTYKAHIFILNRFVMYVPQKCPDRLTDIIWSSGLGYMETAKEMDENPSFQDWAWYFGAYQQWHVALLLAGQICFGSDRPEAERVWKCLDYVFEAPTHLSRREKTIYIYSTALDRLTQYQKYRRHALPLDLQSKIGSSASVTGLGGRGNEGFAKLPRPLQSNTPTAQPYIFEDTAVDWPSTFQQQFAQVASPGQAVNDNSGAEGMDIDWDEIDRLFPIQDAQGTTSSNNSSNTNTISSDLDDFTMPMYNLYTANVGSWDT